MNYTAMAKATNEKMRLLLEKAKSEKRAFTADEKSQFSELQTEHDQYLNMASIENKYYEDSLLEDESDEPVDDGIKCTTATVTKSEMPFKHFSSQLVAVKNFATNGRIDDRLLKVQNAMGGNEGAGADGGFAVQTDFAGTMMESAVQESAILSKVDKYQVSGVSDSVKWVDIDEESIEDSCFGGVRVYWAAEAATVAATKPQLSEKELKLHMLMGFAYTTYELKADSTFTDQLYTRAFNAAISRKLEEGIIGGTGVGQFLGLTRSTALISVAKESGQAAATISWDNISKMYHRALMKSNPGYAWLAHPDAAEQFDFLNFPVGTGGVPVFLPATMLGSVETMRGKPILESDMCSALGTVGDIIYTDLSQYMMAYKGGVDKQTSIHVQFLTAENCFRFIFRANGMPKRSKTLKIKNSSKERSNIIALATRA
jgi:HK97 family phage major capsid protein